MSLFKRKIVPVEVEPFDSWEIVTPTANGDATLCGHLYRGSDPVDALRYIDALANGLRAAGFEAQVSIQRKTVTRR